MADRERCDFHKCEHFFTLKNRNSESSKKSNKWIGMDNLDWDHCRQHHLGSYTEWYEEQHDVQVKEIAALKAKVERLEAQLRQTQSAPKSLPPPPERVEADPRNRVDGFCCALVMFGPLTFKCTEAAKYGYNMCPAHLGHPPKHALIAQAAANGHANGHANGTANGHK